MSALAIIAAGMGCTSKAPPPPPQTVRTLRLQTQTVPVERRYVGRIEPLQSADVRALVTGYVTGFFFQEGDQVRRGRLLFRLDTRPYRIRTAAAAAKLARANADVVKAQALTDQARERARRYLPLAETHAIPQEQYLDAMAAVKIQDATLDRARADRQLARADLAQARLEQGYGEVRSPIAGIVGARHVSVGDLVAAEDARLLVTISDSTMVRIRVSISDADYLRYVGAGAPSANANSRDIDWRLTLADGTRYPMTGHLIAVSRAADPQTGTLELVVQFANPDNRLRPGQYAEVAAELSELHDVLLIPVSCVRVSQGSKTVYVLGPDDLVAQRTITADERSGDSYVVLQGLAAGDTVIVGGEQKVRLGEHVRPQPETRSNGTTPP